MLIVLGNGEVLRHLNRRKIGLNCRCVNCLDFKQNGMPMALILFLCNYRGNFFKNLGKVGHFMRYVNFLFLVDNCSLIAWIIHNINE